ncbi:MAG: putative zinc-finger [Gaiellaceae bacterium]|jgi:anti-sigma factor RsiW|nr:putative zinc-finger [Gaiellaceae bacterium]
MIDSFSTRRCERARAQISALLDGELSELEEADLRVHVDGCADCSAYRADSVSVSRLLRAAPLDDLGFSIAVPRRRYAAKHWVQAGAAAAAVLMAIGLGSAQGLLGGNGGLGSASGSFPASGSSSRTYLQSADYERHLLESLSVPHRGRTGSGVPL